MIKYANRQVGFRMDLLGKIKGRKQKLIFNAAIFVGLGFAISITCLINPELAFLKFDFGFMSMIALIMFLLLLAIEIWAVKEVGLASQAYGKPKKLVTTGPYKFVRNPIYAIDVFGSFFLFIALGYLMLFYIFVFVSIMQLAHAHIEEEELKGLFGREYEEYCKNTKKLVPFIY